MLTYKWIFIKMARWRWWRQFSILTIFYDFLAMNGSKNTISLSKHIGKKYETFTSHFRTLWFCVFVLKNYPQKSNFVFYASRMKLLITTVGWKVEKYKFQFMKEVVKFLFPVWPAVSKAFYKALKRWEEQRSSSSLFNVERSLSPFLAESLECLTLIAFKIDAKK